MQPNRRRKSSVDVGFFTEYGEGSRYRMEEVIGKGSYGVVCSAYDTHTGEKVAIKKVPTDDEDFFECLAIFDAFQLDTWTVGNPK